MKFNILLSLILHILLNFHNVDTTVGISNSLLFPKNELFERCAAKLDCTYIDLDKIPMKDRAVLLRVWQDRVSTVITPINGFKKWEALVGIIQFFTLQNWGEQGSWISLVDTGILEGIERGAEMFLKGSDLDDFGNPGAHLWKQYLIDLKNGALEVKSVHDKRWSESEQASTEQGLAYAVKLKATPNEAQSVVYNYSEYYRHILRNEEEWEPKFSDMCLKSFFNWFTNVENNKPTFFGGNAATLLAPTFKFTNPFELFLKLHEIYKTINPIQCIV